MDPDLLGSETPGAIFEYIESNKDKKKIFETDLFANRYKSGANINSEDLDRDEIDIIIAYDNEFLQKFYKDIILSMPSNNQKLLLKIYTEKRGIYIGSIIGTEAKDKNEFIVKLGNGMKVIYNKELVEKDKDKDIIKIMDFFNKAKFIKIWLELQPNSKNKEIYIRDYEDLSKTNKFQEKIKKYKDQYRLTWYEYLLSAMGYNIFDLNENERKTMNRLFVPRVLSLFPVWLPTADNLYNPYTHLLQLTPPSTGKTKFFILLKGYLDIGYIQGIPTRARTVFNAEKDSLGEIFFSEYILLDEIDKAESQEFIEFMKTMSEGLDSGIWSAEKGNAEKIRELMRGRKLPRGFIFLGNLGEDYATDVERMKEASNIYKYDNARAAAKILLKEKSQGSIKYKNSVDALISRVGIISVVPEYFNVNNIKAEKMINPMGMHELISILKEEINKIANNSNKYIDIQKIKELGQFDDARLENNAIKLAIKIKALEIDKYLNENAEELAVKIVNGTWEWSKKEKA